LTNVGRIGKAGKEVHIIITCLVLVSTRNDSMNFNQSNWL
jgi:hypothetical protein